MLNRIKENPTDKFGLANKLNIGGSTLHSYLRVLLLSGEIKKTKNPSLIPHIQSSKEDAKLVLKDAFHDEVFKKIEDKILDKKELFSILKISEGTYNNWKSKRTLPEKRS